MAVSANPVMKFNARQTIAVDGANSIEVVYTEFDRDLVAYDADSDPDASAVAAVKQAMTAGAATLDLTAVPDIQGGTVDLTGLKIRHILLYNPSDNAITVSEGASNGYALNGGNDIVVGAGCRVQMDLLDTQPAVAAGDKELDLAGTGTDELWIAILAG